MRVSKEFRRVFSEKLMDLGNLSVGALVLGQFVSQQPFSASLVLIGLFLMTFLYVASYFVAQERR